MTNVATIILVVAGAFVATNIDDLVVLTVMFLACRTSGVPRPRQIILGQYMGFAVLVGISGIAALGFAVVAVHWVGLLGLVPLSLGARGLWSAWRNGQEQPAAHPLRLFRGRSGPLAIAVATISAGGDNVSVYTSLLRGLGWRSSMLALGVLFAMLGIWCVIGETLGTSKVIVAALSRIGHILVPFLYVGIGALLLIDSGVLIQLARML